MKGGEVGIADGTKQSCRTRGLLGALFLNEAAIAVLGKESGADDVVDNLEELLTVTAIRACYQPQKGRLLWPGHEELLRIVTD